MLYTLPRVQLFCLHQVYFAIGLIIYVKLSHLLGLFFIEVKYNVIRRIKAKLSFCAGVSDFAVHDIVKWMK